MLHQVAVKYMGTFRKVLALDTEAGCQMIDITSLVGAALVESGQMDGILCVFVPHSTAALVTVEHEPGLEADLKAAVERLIPEGIRYEHHERWGDGNGHSHIRSTFLGASLAIPFHDGKMDLGTWQQVVLMELDVRERSRTVIVQLVGE
jgi:secondary thiamine-phosphate synthase enzyme